MKQVSMFEDERPKEETEYTTKIETPIYEPKNKKPHILELFDKTKYSRLRREIEQSDLPADEKQFLIFAATRHLIFNYGKIADYYAHSSPETQRLMERSALVIIDFDKSYELGYVKLANNIANNYLDTYEE